MRKILSQYTLYGNLQTFTSNGWDDIGEEYVSVQSSLLPFSNVKLAYGFLTARQKSFVNVLAPEKSKLTTEENIRLTAVK